MVIQGRAPKKDGQKSQPMRIENPLSGIKNPLDTITPFNEVGSGNKTQVGLEFLVHIDQVLYDSPASGIIGKSGLGGEVTLGIPRLKRLVQVGPARPDIIRCGQVVIRPDDTVKFLFGWYKGTVACSLAVYPEYSDIRALPYLALQGQHHIVV